MPRCPGLAWVKYASGKSALVETATTRPFWRGHGPAPEGLFALKFNYHRCEEYRATMAEIERRASECHPKASNPAAILADAMGHAVIHRAATEGGIAILQDENHPLTEAFHILIEAQKNVPNLTGVTK